MDKRLQVLKGARELINAGWTRNTFAVTRHGHTCSVLSPNAARFCASGAIHRISQFKGVAAKAQFELRATLEGRNPLEDSSLTLFNDCKAKSKKDVLKLFDDTIKRVSKEHKK